MLSESSYKTGKMPSHIRRGVNLRHLFGYQYSQIGGLLRTRPDTLSKEVQGSRYALSECVNSLGYFISHCWGSDGDLKYLTLLTYFMGGSMVATMTTVALLVCLFQALVYELPTFAIRNDDYFQQSWPVTAWEYGVGCTMGWLFFFFGSTLRHGTHAFLDCVCIHQTDMELKLEGISNLAGFLGCSDKILVLWDAKYFGRLWCIYELAAFSFLNPKGEIKLLPMFVTRTVIRMHAFCFVCCSAFFLLWPYVPGVWGFHCLGFFASGVTLGIAAHGGHGYACQMNELNKALADFDVHRAECQSEDDRQLILASIQDMHGSVENFNTKISKDLRDSMNEDFEQQPSPAPYSMLIIAISPLIPFFISGQSGFRHLPVFFRVAQGVFSTTYCLCFFPLVTAMCMKLGSQILPSESDWDHMKKFIHLGVIGVLGGVIAELYNQLNYIWPCAVGSGALNHLPYAPWVHTKECDAIYMTCVGNFPFWLLGAWALVRRGKASSHYVKYSSLRPTPTSSRELQEGKFSL